MSRDIRYAPLSKKNLNFPWEQSWT